MNRHILGMTRTALCIGAVAMLGCSSPVSDESGSASEPSSNAGYPPKKSLTPKEVFPHVRIDKLQRIVEIDGLVPIDAHDPRAPTVFLETICCIADTREHESLVVTRAKPSHVHAALLLLAYEPGAPGRFEWNGDQMTTVAPTGDAIRVTLITRDDDGNEVEHDPSDWIVNLDTGNRFGSGRGAEWVFAGSRMVEREGHEVYDADGAGVVVGLHTFGSEVVALRDVISPEADLESPVWVADGEVVPAVGTPVIVRFTVR